MRKGNFNYRFILKTIGFLLIIESLFMLLSAIVSFYYHEKAGDAFLISSSITIVVGIFLRLAGIETYERNIGKRESFLVVALTWVILSAFGMLPFYFSGVIPDISNAYFETMSGFTTTGSTIITDIDSVPRGLLFWRSLTQWIGGIGIVVFALALLPMIGGNASVLYDAETTGIVRERFQPRVTQVAKRLWVIYVSLTATVFLLLCLSPMGFFDSICHAMSALATGGYSTKNAGVAFWNSSYIEYVLIIAMFIGGINFSLLYFFFKGSPKKLFKDEEFRWYFWICTVFIVVIAVALLYSEKIFAIEEAFRASAFTVISIITTTGFTGPEYIAWGPFYIFATTLLMFFCACAGSTSGGMKTIRLVVLVKNAVNEFKLQVHPNAILPVRLNGTVISMEVVTKILAFIFLYIGIIVISFLVLSLSGLNFEESIGAAVSCMGNVGPGLGDSGLEGHFAEIPTFSKWYLCFLMLTGRLELFTVLSLFMPAFWKR